MKVLEINKEDFKYNINIIKRINEETLPDDKGNKPTIIAVVKGNGMGLDLVESSKFFIENGIDFLAVSTTEEAIELRKAEIKEKILMLSPVTSKAEIKELIENNIILTIGSKKSAENVNEVAKELKEIANVHIKIDTGFGRYGFLYNDVNTIIETLKDLNNIEIKGTFTHFSKSMDEKWTNIQFNRFLNAIAELKRNQIETGMLHACNSTAFLNYPNMRLNAVRIGSAFQGRVLAKENFNLKPIGVLKTTVEQVKTVPKNFYISYFNRYKTKKETKIAVIPVGNMDGYNVIRDKDSFRFVDKIIAILVEVKNVFRDKRLFVYINDNKYFVLGKAGMYHIIVDITGTNIVEEDIVKIPASPILVNPKIRREYN